MKAQPIPAAINRAAYYFSNWGGMLEAVREHGRLPSFFPADLAIPMVAPKDVGEAAARRMLELRQIEGPRPKEVAAAFGDALGRTIDVAVIPREQWEPTFLKLGFSPAAAASYACMTGTVVDDDPEMPHGPERGRTSLQEFIRSLVRQ